MLALLASIGAFLPGLFGKKLSFEAARATGIVVLVIALVLVVGLGKCAYDKSVVSNYKSERAAKVAEDTLEADRAAAAAEKPRTEAFRESQAEIERETAKAAQRDPTGAARPVGPVTQSYYDNLRKKEPR